jgi:hypothetical protein
LVRHTGASHVEADHPHLSLAAALLFASLFVGAAVGPAWAFA